MNERETAAAAAGLKDMALLKIHPEDAPIDAVIADLKARFGKFPAAFRDIHQMPRAAFEREKAEMLCSVERDRRGRFQPAPVVDARALSPAAYEASKAAMLRDAL